MGFTRQSLKDIIFLGLVVQGVVFVLFPLDKLVHSSEHVALLVGEKTVKRFVDELHMLFYLCFYVFALIQLAKVADHILGNKLLFEQVSILTPYNICFIKFMLVLSHSFLPLSLKYFSPNVVDIAINDF